MNNFELGQIVYHKSDLEFKTPLVITDIKYLPIVAVSRIICEWFFEGTVKSNSFIPEALVFPKAKEQTQGCFFKKE